MEPLEKEARTLKTRLEEIGQEIHRYVRALGQGTLSLPQPSLPFFRTRSTFSQFENIEDKFVWVHLNDFQKALKGLGLFPGGERLKGLPKIPQVLFMEAGKLPVFLRAKGPLTDKDLKALRRAYDRITAQHNQTKKPAKAKS